MPRCSSQRVAVRPTRRIGWGDMAIVRPLEGESPGGQRGEVLAHMKLACGMMTYELKQRLIFSNSRCFYAYSILSVALHGAL